MREEIPMTATMPTPPIELDFRAHDGVEVSLLWQPDSDVVVVDVLDTRAGDRLQLVVDPEEALDVFRHPFAYAAFRGVPLPAPRAPEEVAPLAA
jgi:hypothetical protein